MIPNHADTHTTEAPGSSEMSCKIYVGNLAWATDENALGSHFTSIGKVKEAVVMRTEGRSRGFGFVTFATPDEAKQAIATMYDSELHGRRLRVNVANQQSRAGVSGPGDYPMTAGVPPGGYHYPTAVYPGGGGQAYPGGPYGAYPNPHDPSQPGSYIRGYTNSGAYPGHESSGYHPPPNGVPSSDHHTGGNHTGGFYTNGAPYNYPPGGYGY